MHDVWDEPFEASLVTDVTAAVGVGAALLLMAATDTAPPPAAGTVLGMILAPHPCENGLLAGARHMCSPWRIDRTH